ncbi:MAG: tyrosine--tRNA ligase [Pseudomonadales bacterium]|nr:tyrosine--tRNA ligase [Candidatus Woesebacteria bacterium]MCB9801176.1 tyrosine--tRNA ligase [Pseudomonadales bacterium]
MKKPDIDTVLKRGVAEVLPDKKTLKELMEKRKVRVYLGIDPTGSLLTLGHSVVLRKLQQFADLGHEVILLIGNGTVKIGDPTGKDSTRPELTDKEIEANFKTWKQQASKILDFEKIEIKHNGDWLDELTYSDMVKLMAKTTVQQLMERDMFQDRLKAGRPIHGHEIMYPLLQGYDSVAMDVDLEIGGTDQTFNMMMGRSLQKQYNNKEKWVLTTPIINGTDGRKMSKSYGNFIALTEEPNDMYGKLMSVADEMIIEYFTVLTDVADDEISEMAHAIAGGENPMEYKKRLAFTVTEMYHTTADAETAEDHFQRTVQNKELPDDMQEINIEEANSVLDAVKLCVPEESTSNIRRLINQNAVEFFYGQDSEKPDNPFATLETEMNGKPLEIIRVGKRRFFKVVLE